jgi:hypothetical protein
MRNTHSAFIAGDGFSAFIDGIPNDHECDSKGDAVYITKSGKRVYWHTIRKWASLTSEARLPLLEKHFREIDDPILGGSCTCSKCGSVAIDQAMWL